MSYNGIGLQTPRGSGTNGHISRNLSSVRSREPYSSSFSRSEPQFERKAHADLGILQHEAKRQIANRVLIYKTALDDTRPSLNEADILAQTARYRTQLEEEALRKPSTIAADGRQRPSQSHQITVAKEREMDAFKSAIRMPEHYQEGSATRRRRDTEVQEKDKIYDPSDEPSFNPLDRRLQNKSRRDREDRLSEQPPEKEISRKSRRTRRRSEERWRHERTDFKADSSRSSDDHQRKGEPRVRSSYRYRGHARLDDVVETNQQRYRSSSAKRDRFSRGRSHSNVSACGESRESNTSRLEPDETLVQSFRDERRCAPGSSATAQVTTQKATSMPDASSYATQSSAPMVASTEAPIFDRRKALGID